MFQYFETILPSVESWKAFDLLYKMRYILWVVALLEAFDVTTMVATLAATLDFTEN